MNASATSPFDIERARPDELPVLYTFASMAFASENGWNENRTLRVLNRAQIYVAHEAGRPVGYVALRADGDRYLIEQVLVAPGNERRGIGKLLLAYAEGLAISRHARILQIVCESHNRAAESLYGRLGFARVESELFERTLPHL